MFQWKQFQFFSKDVVKNDKREPLKIFQELEVTCSTSGRGAMIFGDTEGYITVVNRDFTMSSFHAYERRVTHVAQLMYTNVLLSVGDDEEAISPTLKVWNMEKTDKSGSPMLLRNIRLERAVLVTSLAYLEDLTQVAVGMCNGVVVLLRNLEKERNPKQLRLQDEGRDPITGLGFKVAGDITTLFVAMPSSITAYRTSPRVSMQNLDERGCELNCITSGDEGDLIVGREEAVYFYGPEGLGPCFAFEGYKKRLAYFKSYLIVVNKDIKNPKYNTLKIYDLKNKFVAYSSSFQNVAQIIPEWNHIYILTHEGKLYQLIEKDTQTKLETLFNKLNYPAAISLAYNQNLDFNTIVDIYRRYGDHQYSKKMYDQAISQYIRTIGKLEPSYVIRKFLDAQRIHNLTSYLQALHEKGLANADHTTLLLNCYTKLNDVGKLDNFIMGESDEVSFDVETAIKVCRQAGYHRHALYLAQRHHKHHYYLKILLDDVKDHHKALEYMATLPFFEAEKNLKQYGKTLVTSLPEETTRLLMSLSSGYTPMPATGVASSAASVLSASSSEVAQPSSVNAVPEDFIHIFVDQPEWLERYLEFIVQHGGASSVVHNTLLEMYLRESAPLASDEGSSAAVLAAPRLYREEKVMALLTNPRAKFDEDHALVLCQMHDFTPGVLYIYDKLGLYREILSHHMEHNDNRSVIQSCKRHGDKDPDLWVQALSYFAKKDEACSIEIMQVLENIDRANLLPPLLVIQILAQKETASLAVIKDYITRRLRAEQQMIEDDRHEIRSYEEETEKMRKEIHALQTSARIFKLSKCTMCGLGLEPPATHFLCMHSFHKLCLNENERECPVCTEGNQKIIQIRRSLQKQAMEHDRFFNQIEDSADGFATVAKYFGRGIFDSTSTERAI